MKTLILLRHAKSEDPSILKTDFNRNLKTKGIDNIHAVAKIFLEYNIQPDIVLCSAANRTIETIAEFQKAINTAYNVHYMEELYHASASNILEIIQNQDSNADVVMVVGHNFGISELALYLGEKACSELPTSGLVVFQFTKQIHAGEGKCLHFITPKTI